jgi:hypothetical protein
MLIRPSADGFCAEQTESDELCAPVWRLVNLSDIYRSMAMLSCTEHLDILVRRLTEAGWNVAFQPYPDGAPIPTPKRSG